MISICRFAMPEPLPGSAFPSEETLKQVYLSRLNAMSGQMFVGESAAPPSDPGSDSLLLALASDDHLQAESAAIVAGLCRAENPEANRHITEALRPRALARGPLAIEAATALVRRGEHGAINELLALSEATDPYGEPFRAAQILAELGRPERLEVMAAAIAGPIQADRGMAARGLSLWAPYTSDVAIRTRLVSLLEEVANDPNPMVRREMPTATGRLGLHELEGTLRRLGMEDADAVVRLMANGVLEGWASR